MSSYTSVNIARKLIENKIQKLHELLDERKSALNEELNEIEEAFSADNKKDQEELEKWRNYKEQTLELFQDDVTENVQLSKIEARIEEVSRTLEMRRLRLEWDEDKLKMEIGTLGTLQIQEQNPKPKQQQTPEMDYESLDEYVSMSIPENEAAINSHEDITEYANLADEQICMITPKGIQAKEHKSFQKPASSGYLKPMKQALIKRTHLPKELIPSRQDYTDLKRGVGSLIANLKDTKLRSRSLSSDRNEKVELYAELPEQKPGWQLHFSHKSETEENSNQTGLYPTPKPEDCTVINTCTRGTDPGQILKPKNVAVSPKTGCIFVAEKANNRVQVFTPTGEPLFSFGTRGKRLSMAEPYGVCVLNEKVYVSQTENHCIMVFKTNGDYCMQGGNKGKNEGSFEYPTGLSTDGTNVLVCDFGNHRVQVFSNNLIFKQMIGIGKLTNPKDVAVNSNSNLVVLDRSPTCVHIFNSKGVYQRKLINVSKCPTLSNPLFIAISPRGNIVLSDMLTCSVNIFNMDGQLLWCLGGLHDKETFGEPRGVATDPLGRLVVVCGKEIGCLKIMEIHLPNLF